MQAPRWFHAVLAFCAVVLTIFASAALLSLAFRLRYTADPEHGALVDNWHRTYCLTGGCVRFDDSVPGDTLALPATAMPVDSTVGTPGQPRRPAGLDSMFQARPTRP